MLAKPPIDTLWLNPLAFPRNPYHRLVKHYQDGRLKAGHVNDPELDARLVLEVLADQLDALGELQRRSSAPARAYHWLTTTRPDESGFDAVFAYRARRAAADRQRGRASDPQGAAWRSLHPADRRRARRARPAWLADGLRFVLDLGRGRGFGHAALGARAFPEASAIVRHLRDTPCEIPIAPGAARRTTRVGALSRWFGFDAFRPEPKGDVGRPLQERIVDEAMRGASVLGILPTGTGKSVCYQIPALAKFEKTGALTVVISPLVALMADQVQGMRGQGFCPASPSMGCSRCPSGRMRWTVCAWERRRCF